MTEDPFVPLETLLYEDLKRLCETFATAAGYSVATIAKRATGDDSFFNKHRDGRSFKVRTYDAAVLWFSDNWPDGVDWPEGHDSARPPENWKLPERPVAPPKPPRPKRSKPKRKPSVKPRAAKVGTVAQTA